jgi:hypothetical protein
VPPSGISYRPTPPQNYGTWCPGGSDLRPTPPELRNMGPRGVPTIPGTGTQPSKLIRLHPDSTLFSMFENTGLLRPLDVTL